MAIETTDLVEDILEKNALVDDPDDLTNELEPWHTEEE